MEKQIKKYLTKNSKYPKENVHNTQMTKVWTDTEFQWKEFMFKNIKIELKWFLTELKKIHEYGAAAECINQKK